MLARQIVDKGFGWHWGRTIKVCAVPYDDGLYMDIGTAQELDAALKKFHL